LDFNFPIKASILVYGDEGINVVITNYTRLRGFHHMILQYADILNACNNYRRIISLGIHLSVAALTWTTNSENTENISMPSASLE